MSGLFRFAVDLGTSNTVAVVDRGDGTPRPLLFDGNPLLPSAVFADPSGTVFVGRDAERHMMTDAARFEPNPKGHIDDGVILLGDRELPVAELFAAILRRVAAEAAQTGVPVGGATVLTCPVDWGNTRRGVLLEAAARAGLGRVTLLDEPVAAATYCVRALGSRLAPGRCVVVFDFGGGTLDVTVVQSTPPEGHGLRVLASGGLDDLGGTDIDAALVGHLGQLVAAADEERWRRLAEPRTTGEFRDRRMFWSEVRAAKEMLSRSSAAPIHVPGSEQATHLTREELDRIAGPLVDRAVDETRRVLQRSGVPAGGLDAIVLVGGSSRLPLVASRLHARFGLAPVVPEQPELPVAFGALLLANDRQHADPFPATGGFATATGRHAPGSPAEPVSGGYRAAAPVSGGLAPAVEPVAPVRHQPRPSVIIGPGVTLQGNVAVYGDADLMPEYARDEPAPRPREEPAEEPVRGERRGTRRRVGGGIVRRLRLLALPLIPWVLIMALTPWGRGLFNDGKAKVESLFGAGAAPSASTGAGASQAVSPQPSGTRSGQAVFQLERSSGPRGASVKVTCGGFQAAEEVQFLVGGKQIATLTADRDGKVKGSITPASGTTRTGALTIQARGRKSNRSATAPYTVTA